MLRGVREKVAHEEASHASTTRLLVEEREAHNATEEARRTLQVDLAAAREMTVELERRQDPSRDIEMTRLRDELCRSQAAEQVAHAVIDAAKQQLEAEKTAARQVAEEAMALQNSLHDAVNANQSLHMRLNLAGETVCRLQRQVDEVTMEAAARPEHDDEELASVHQRVTTLESELASARQKASALEQQNARLKQQGQQHFSFALAGPSAQALNDTWQRRARELDEERQLNARLQELASAKDAEAAQLVIVARLHGELREAERLRDTGRELFTRALEALEWVEENTENPDAAAGRLQRWWPPSLTLRESADDVGLEEWLPSPLKKPVDESASEEGDETECDESGGEDEEWNEDDDEDDEDSDDESNDEN
jgi:hypothetical protein